FDADQPYSLLIAPDILLYLCLRHASIWLRDPEMEQYWMAKAQEAAQALQQQLDEANWSGSALVVPAFSA
ncbi:phage adaptor protein, partial [Herbiconiux daphne]